MLLSFLLSKKKKVREKQFDQKRLNNNLNTTSKKKITKILQLISFLSEKKNDSYYRETTKT